MAEGTANKFLDAALRLQHHGFRIFPLVPGTKDPLVKEYAEVASADEEKARIWWSECPISGRAAEHNIGIACRNLADGWRLVGVDVDNKDGRHGDDDILALELEGKDFPDTFEQKTPSGGRHLIYRTRARIGNSTKRVAPGIDIRGRGGYLVGAGSEINGEAYTANFAAVAEAPKWLISALDRLPSVVETDGSIRLSAPEAVDPSYARKRGEAYVSEYPGAEKGTRGSTAYLMACRLRDFGVESYSAFEVMSEWAERCSPPMPDEDLIVSVENAYRYARDKEGGSAAPELAFPDEEPEPEPKSPIEKLNKEFAFVINGRSHHIIWETVDDYGVPIVKHIDEQTFHHKFLADQMDAGKGKMEAVTKVWMRSPKRRSFDGFCFRPGQEVSPRFYNFWRGFKYEPLKLGEKVSEEWQNALDSFLQHIRINVCGGDEDDAKWLIGFFAHMVQRPWEKPHVALVFQGEKGVGKSFLVERIGALLGRYFVSVANPRFLTGNFNSHLEQNICFVGEEAFYSGDQKVDGIIKHLITGEHHLIERKGQEPYEVKNCSRIIFIGNEEWLVRATGEERRYAVFKVGNKRQQDWDFFAGIKDAMESGGYRLLLTYLLNYDLTGINVHKAPKTEGLLDQKMSGLSLAQKHWYECLLMKQILGSPEDEWPTEITAMDLRESCGRWARSMNRSAAIPDARSYGRQLHKYAPGLTRKYSRNGYLYAVPDIETARLDFSFAIKHPVSWE